MCQQPHFLFTIGPSSLLVLIGRARRIGVEGTQAAVPPSGEQIGAALVRMCTASQPVRQLQEGAEQGGAIIVRQLDQARLVDEATEFDQVACTLAPFARPIAGIRAGACGDEAVTLHHQSPQQGQSGSQLPKQVRCPRRCHSRPLR